MGNGEIRGKIVEVRASEFESLLDNKGLVGFVANFVPTTGVECIIIRAENAAGRILRRGSREEQASVWRVRSARRQSSDDISITLSVFVGISRRWPLWNLNGGARERDPPS